MLVACSRRTQKISLQSPLTQFLKFVSSRSFVLTNQQVLLFPNVPTITFNRTQAQHQSQESLTEFSYTPEVPLTVDYSIFAAKKDSKGQLEQFDNHI